ncbi:hypothetical protein LXA43DRAFT_854590, partial [Ganoderma leucocontextum]
GVPIFLENLDGTVMDKHAFSDLNAVIKLSYHSLKAKGWAAASWGKMSREGYEYMEKQVTKNFPAICEAEKNWKFQTLMTTTYPNLIRDRTAAGNPAKENV